MNTRIFLLLLVSCSLTACRACDSSAPTAVDSGVAKEIPPPPTTAPECSDIQNLRPGTLPPWAHKDAQRYWALFEKCMMKQGSACERAWVGGARTPRHQGLPPADQEQERANFMRVCESLPPDVQRCMTPFAFAHQAECPPQKIRALFEQASAKLGIAPPAPPPPVDQKPSPAPPAP